MVVDTQLRGFFLLNLEHFWEENVFWVETSHPSITWVRLVLVKNTINTAT